MISKNYTFIDYKAFDILSPKILEVGEKSKVQGSRLHGKLKDALESRVNIKTKSELHYDAGTGTYQTSSKNTP